MDKDKLVEMGRRRLSELEFSIPWLALIAIVLFARFA